jgi:hypothetical protein
LVTSIQLEPSANAPCSKTIVGFGWVCDDRVACAVVAPANNRPAPTTEARTRRLMLSFFMMITPSVVGCG